jgi:outer membrane immunogenic protein
MKAIGLLLFGTAILASGSLAAHADGMPRPAPAYPPPNACGTCDVLYLGYDWSGFYLGGHAGMANSSSAWTVPGLGFITTGTVGFVQGDFLEHSATGFAGGAHLGWQKQWGNTVAGLELAYTGLNTDVTSHTAILGVPIVRSTEVSNLLLVTGRLGYAQDNMLAYAKGGYATGEVEFDLRVGNPAVISGSSSDREHGWTAGVGLEYAIRENLILGVEYNYVHFNVDSRTLVPALAIANNASVDLQSILARISFKFGGRPEAVPVP